jgi:hypothetical protein
MRRVHDSYVSIEIPVDRVAQQPRFKIPVEIEVSDLAFGVNAGIRPARAVNGDRSVIEERKNSGQLTLNGSAVRLYLPPVIVRAVILNGYPEVMH